MTTIVWHGKTQTLAADRQACAAVTRRITKIWRLPDGSLFGGAGVFEQVQVVRDWLIAGEPKQKPGRLNSFTGLLISPEGKAFRLESRLNRSPIQEPWHAIGSGQAFALTAMLLGKTAREAIAIAARFDADTGGGVDVLERRP